MVKFKINDKTKNTFLLKDEKNPLHEIKKKLNPYFVTGYSDGES
jgi:hypothetical protein